MHDLTFFFPAPPPRPFSHFFTPLPPRREIFEQPLMVQLKSLTGFWLLNELATKQQIGVSTPFHNDLSDLLFSLNGHAALPWSELSDSLLYRVNCHGNKTEY